VGGWELVRVWHYTDQKGYNGINGSGIIRMGNPNRRAKGATTGKPTGVYVTRVEPENLGASNPRGKMGLTNKKVNIIFPLK